MALPNKGYERGTPDAVFPKRKTADGNSPLLLKGLDQALASQRVSACHCKLIFSGGGLTQVAILQDSRPEATIGY